MQDSLVNIFLEREEQSLSPYAFRTSQTRGRERYQEPCRLRTEFQRDRDKITHCQSFRRLMNKTQVFLAPEGDHYRTRLTHTLEVTQIARIMARALRLNEDLTEAAALGHDLGHTPFGHAGERALQQCFSPDFTHFMQSVRVVEVLENDGMGLNLTWEVRDGIAHHSGSIDTCGASTLEGVLVKYADKIAYINHDIDDACRAGIMKLEDIPAHLRECLGQKHSQRINTMVTSVIRASTDRGLISMTPEVQAATNELRDFLFEHVYLNPLAKGEEGKAEDMLIKLYEYFVKHPEKLPQSYLRNTEKESVERCVCDYVAGMTDRYAIQLYSDLFIPQVWRGR